MLWLREVGFLVATVAVVVTLLVYLSVNKKIDSKWVMAGFGVLIALLWTSFYQGSVQPSSWNLSWFEDNFGLSVDPNYYFFANHPRERVEVAEIEKLSFVWLPFFLVGLLNLVNILKKKQNWVIWLLPIVWLTLLGDAASKGSVIMMPLLVLSIIKGLELTWGKIR